MTEQITITNPNWLQKPEIKAYIAFFNSLLESKQEQDKLDLEIIKARAK